MRNQILTIIILFALIFSSCSHDYTPALYHQDIAYLPKPASFDSAKVATYVSLGGAYYNNTNYSDALESGQVNLSQGITFKNVNLAYGVFGVAGSYENSHNTDDASADNFNSKFFGAIGGRASINLYANDGQFDIRYLGVEAAYSHEFGDYANFRKALAGTNASNTDVDPRTDLISLGLTSEIYFHSRNNINLQHGIRVFFGGTFGHYDQTYDNTFDDSNTDFFHQLYPKVSYFIKYKKYFGAIEVGNGAFMRLGLQF